MLLPDGTRLLHIGPHKTGTTSVQGAFHHARRAVAAQGVLYPGANPHAGRAAHAVAARSTAGRTAGSRRAWSTLLGEVRRARGRALISSEWFSDATPKDIRRIVDDLDPTRIHVAITLRPLPKLLASQWQQFVQGGTTFPYEQWLRSVFDEPASGTAKRFWHRHRHDALVERWAAVVGPERVTAIVVDDRDHTAVLRVFERLLGLTPGTLELVPDRANRSLTQPEAELVRAMNDAFGRIGLEGPPRLDLVLFGAAANLKARVPGPGEPSIATPPWAVERATAVAAEIAEGIERSGVRVVGDLSQLAAAAGRPAANRASATADGGDRTDDAWPDITATAGVGVLTAGGLARSGARTSDIEPFSSQRIRSVLFGRLLDAVTGS